MRLRAPRRSATAVGCGFHLGLMDKSGRLCTMLTSAKVILSSSKGDFGRSEARFDEISMLQSWVAREA